MSFILFLIYNIVLFLIINFTYFYPGNQKLINKHICKSRYLTLDLYLQMCFIEDTFTFSVYHQGNSHLLWY